MKKYQQLLIVSLGLVSFICFLIYKHEYDRLRNVLEVLEVFGSPPPQTAALLSHQSQSHPLDLGHNPNLGVGSINELKLGQGGLIIPLPDQQNREGENKMRRNKDNIDNNNNVIQVPIQNSGEVMDNLVDDGGGGVGDGDKLGIGKFGALKSRKQRPHSQQESIFKETQYQKEGNNVNEAF